MTDEHHLFCLPLSTHTTTAAILADYAEYCDEHERGPVFSWGSIERYILGWCEQPDDAVIAVLVSHATDGQDMALSAEL